MLKEFIFCHTLKFEVLATSPKAFSQVATSQCTISQAVTSQKLGYALWGAAVGNGGRVLRLGWTRGPSAAARTGWGPSAAARTYFGSCHLKNCTYGKFPFRKIPLGSCHLGKILWESIIKLYYPYIFTTWWCKPFIFQTIIIWSKRIYSLKHCVALQRYGD